MRFSLALEHLKKLVTVSPQEKEEVRQAVLTDEKYRLLDPARIEEKIVKKERNLLLRKEAHLKRLTSDDCLNAIRQKGPADAKSVIETVLNKSRTKIILSSIVMGLLAVGIAITVASLFLNPIGLMVVSAIGLATTLGWVLIDAYSLIQNYHVDDPGRFDKVWIFLSTVMTIITVSLVFFLSGGIAPIIAALVVGSVWMGINVICYYRIHQFERKKNQLTTQ